MATANSTLQASPHLIGRCTGAFYLTVIVTTIYGTAIAPGTRLGHTAGLASAVAYVTVTALLYHLLKPVGAPLALLAAFLNLKGVAHQKDSLVFFGPFCLVTGYLVFSSTFLPWPNGVLMMLAGLGLLTNALSPLLWPSHPPVLSTMAWSLDGLGETSFTLWLVVFGVDAQRWRQRASRTAIQAMQAG